MSLYDDIHTFIASNRHDDEVFNSLACRVFAHQYETIPLVAALAKRAGKKPEAITHWSEVPALPASAFKATQLFGGTRIRQTFQSSGTSGATKSQSAFSDEGLSLMGESVRANASRYLFPEGRTTRILVLAPSPEFAPQMIMAWGMAELIRVFGLDGSRFLIDAKGLDPAEVLGELRAAASEGVPVTLIGASFGFVHLLDGMREAGLRIQCAPGSRTMDAGGYKGRSRELSRGELDSAIMESLGVPSSRAINLLGMTELASQFYDGVLRLGSSELRRKENAPWTATRVLAPESLEPVNRGERGLLMHVDLANLERPAFVRTDDIGVADEHGFEVLGRAQGTDSRGCSLSVEELVR